MSEFLLNALPFAANEPAGGAALDQVVIATLGATIATAVLVWLALGHRSGRVPYLTELANFSERVSGLPGWAALPSAVSAGALLIALLGMYWDISLHIDVGRDAGPLANPAHYLILVGLFGIFAAGVLAITLPRGDIGPSAFRLAPDWPVPVGGVLISAAAAFALIGFPLDDIWHRLFGQDVTLWGPTHLMLIGGAGLSLIGMAALLVEGTRARSGGRAAPLAFLVAFRRVGLMGGLLVGLSTFQAEFDFGVPQFQMIFQPVLIALAAGIGLTCARIWIGRGGAFGAVAFFLVIRGGLALIVGPLLGETTPALPLYVVEAGCVELVGLWLGRDRPLALGAVSGVLIGTVGFAAEFGWSQLVMPLPWNDALLLTGPILAVAAAVAGGLVGGLLGAALRGELPRPAVARAVALGSLVAVMALIGNGLVTTAPDNVRASVQLTDVRGAPQREVSARVRVEPAGAANDAKWLTITSWQGGGLVVDRLERTGAGTYRTSEPIPVYGEWKSTLRMQTGRSVLAVPVYLPKDTAIPAPEVPAKAQFTRRFVDDKDVLQRETKQGVPSWLTTAAPLVVLAIALSLLTVLALGLARLGHREGEPREVARRRARIPAMPRTRIGGARS